MKREDDFARSSVAIIGLGLMGGSLGMALRGHCKRLLGIDRDPRVLELALARGVVDAGHTDPGVLLPQANIIILAVPVCAILEMLQQIPAFHPGPAIVLDVGSTKSQILHAMNELPPKFDPIGGHPMCGKETSGLEHADPSIYQEAPFALIALKRTSPEARSVAETLVQTIGASPIWLDPKTHDTWVAFTSQLPYLLAIALAEATPLEAASLVGPGFLGATRLAGSSPEMMADILVTNQVKVVEALKQFQLKLDVFGRAVQEGNRDLLIAQLETAYQQRKTLIRERGSDEA
ncbi:MAG: hypothetical protein A2Z14_02465 [Chloroflexi bacterium RBG_16_48_8]|nr:MAG: hypothetical protein A2Z14_02465 [Chloroflexi bacterium RBG_16_48_8]